METRFLRLIAGLLITCFSVYLVPNELVHALYGHDDTHHECSPAEGETIESHHTHCDFLSYEGALFTAASVTGCPVSSEHSFAFFTAETEQAGITPVIVPSLRGPPLS